MNFAPSLSTVHCCGCGNEFRPEQLNENGHCLSCRVDLQLAVDAERAADFQSLSREALVDRVVERSRARAKLLQPTTYSFAAPSLVRVINESMVKARELLGERFGAAS